MSLTLEFTQERIENNLENFRRISDEISLDKLTLPAFVWAEKTVLNLYSDLFKSQPFSAEVRPEPLNRLDALCYAYPEVQSYLNFRSTIESLLDNLNDLEEDEIESGLSQELKTNLTAIRDELGIEPGGLEHVRLFRIYDCFSSESPPVVIQDLRKAVYIVSSQLLRDNKE